MNTSFTTYTMYLMFLLFHEKQKTDFIWKSSMNHARFSNIIFAITPNINIHIDSLILPVDQTFTIQRNRVEIRCFKMHSIDRRISIVEN